MDKQILALLIPITALAIPLAAVIMGGMLKLWRLKVEDARLRTGGQHGGGTEVQALRDELESVHRQLSELNERVDFTERLLARGGRDSSERGSKPQP